MRAVRKFELSGEKVGSEEEREIDTTPQPGDGEMEDVACCPECESLEIREVASTNPRQITLWSSAIPLPEPPTQVSRRWKCLMCGYQWRDAEE